MDIEAYVAQRLIELEQQRTETIAALRIIEEKLTKAEAKHLTEPGSEHFGKWRDILRTLEGQLREQRSRLASIEAEIGEKTKRQAELQDKARLESEHKAQVIERIKTMTPEQFSTMTAEDMAILQEYELAHGAMTDCGAGAVAPGDSDAASATPPDPAPAHQTPPMRDTAPVRGTEPATVPENRPPVQRAGPSIPEETQKRLAKALQTALSGATAQLTLSEVDLLLAFYGTLRQRPESDAAALQCKENLGGAMRRAHDEFKRLCAKWEQLRPTNQPPAA